VEPMAERGCARSGPPPALSQAIESAGFSSWIPWAEPAEQRTPKGGRPHNHCRARCSCASPDPPCCRGKEPALTRPAKYTRQGRYHWLERLKRAGARRQRIRAPMRKACAPPIASRSEYCASPPHFTSRSKYRSPIRKSMRQRGMQLSTLKFPVTIENREADSMILAAVSATLACVLPTIAQKMSRFRPVCLQFQIYAGSRRGMSPFGLKWATSR
jgi:hypothetical protein